MTIEGLRLGRLFPVIAAVTLGAFAGCASSTVLQTTPPGATVSVNGFVVGRTPYTLTDTKIVGSSTPLHFEYPGYAPLDVMLVRNEEVDVLPLIGGIFFLVPFLWIMKYSPNHDYQLQPLRPGQNYPGARAYPPGYPPAQTYPAQTYPAQTYPPAGGYPPPPSAPAAPSGPAGYPPPPPGYPPPAQ